MKRSQVKNEYIWSARLFMLAYIIACVCACVCVGVCVCVRVRVCVCGSVRRPMCVLCVRASERMCVYACMCVGVRLGA
jgi:hypothetical protein